MTPNLHPDLMPDNDRVSCIASAAACLRAAADMLAEPHRWTQGAMARDAKAHPVGPTDPNAVRWCLSGAMQLQTRGLPHGVSIIADRALRSVCGGAEPAGFNDRASSAVQVASLARIAAAQLEE